MTRLKKHTGELTEDYIQHLACGLFLDESSGVRINLTLAETELAKKIDAGRLWQEIVERKVKAFREQRKAKALALVKQPRA